MAENKYNQNIQDDMNEADLFSLVWLHHDDELDEAMSQFVGGKLASDTGARNIAKMASDVSAVITALPEVQPPQALRNAILASTTRQSRQVRPTILHRLGRVLLPTYRTALGSSAAALILVGGALALYHHDNRVVVSRFESPRTTAYNSRGTVPTASRRNSVIAMASSSPSGGTISTGTYAMRHGRLNHISGLSSLPTPTMRLPLHLAASRQLPRLNHPEVVLTAVHSTIRRAIPVENTVQMTGYARQEDLNQPMLAPAVDTAPVVTSKPTIQLVVSHSPIAPTPPPAATSSHVETIRWQPVGGEGDSVAAGNHPGGVVMVDLPARNARGIYAPVVLDTLRHGEAGLPISLSHF